MEFKTSAKVLTHDTEADWLDSRQAGIGASESASIFGVGYATESPLTVWNRKVGGPQPTLDDATLALFRRGHRMEPVIAAEFADAVGLEVHDTGARTIYQHHDHSWMFATLDRFVIDPELGYVPTELKNVNGRFRKEWDEDIDPPLKYVVQCQHQMAVTGASHAYLVGLIGGDELAYRLIPRNDRFIEAMITKLAEFWRLVESRTMPEVDGSEATGKVLGLIHPHDNSDAVDLPEGAVDWDRELIDVNLQLRDVKTKKTAIENKIKAAIGDATFGDLPFASGRYSWKLQRRESYTVKATEFRVLRRSSS